MGTTSEESLSEKNHAPPPGSLQELMDRMSGRHLKLPVAPGESGILDIQPFPFLALVGQREMKLALLLGLINPLVGGVLLVGPRGTGKTTAVRSLSDLLPEVPRSLCRYGCMPEDIEAGGMDAVCPDCASKYGQGEPLAVMDKVRLLELPLNARLEDVVGYVEDRLSRRELYRVRKGLLAQADRNILYVDEVNLLSNEIIDAILDASAQGRYTVRRGSLAATYHSRFVLIGSMNPEEGELRPQILDRFGLRLLVGGLEIQAERLEAYRRARAYHVNPILTVNQYTAAMQAAQDEIQAARDRLPAVELPEPVMQVGLDLIAKLQIISLRAEITLFEAARAYAAADGRREVITEDLRQVAPMSLRLRRSAFITRYLDDHKSEDEEIAQALNQVIGPSDLLGENQ